MRNIVLAAAIASGLAACNLASTYTRPVAPIASSLGDMSEEASHPHRPDQLGWEEFFEDARLKALISAALERNQDLAQSVARIEQARAQYRAKRADRLPSIGASGDATQSRQSAGRAASGAVDPGAQGGAVEVEQYSAGVEVSAFELDLWGRVFNLSESERLRYLASEEGARAFRLSLISQVASTYYDIESGEERIRLAAAALAGRQEGVEIARVRLDAGLTSTVDFNQAVVLQTQAQTELADVRRAEAQARNLLDVLTGGPVVDGLPDAKELTLGAQLKPISDGLSSELLYNRPDVLEAELNLQSANANIGAARAAFFPSISLTSQYGYISSELSSLVKNANRTWSYGAAIDLPIFDWGRRKAQLRLSESQADELLAAYKSAVQRAFQEVADALASRQYLADQIVAQRLAVATQKDLSETARLRYEAGVSTYLEVLDAERSLFSAEQQLVQLIASELQNSVALYVALGGGSAAS